MIVNIIKHPVGISFWGNPILVSSAVEQNYYSGLIHVDPNNLWCTELI